MFNSVAILAQVVAVWLGVLIPVVVALGLPIAPSLTVFWAISVARLVAADTSVICSQGLLPPPVQPPATLVASTSVSGTRLIDVFFYAYAQWMYDGRTVLEGHFWTPQ